MTVVAGYLHPGTVSGEFCRSLVNVTAQGSISAQIPLPAGPNLTAPRNQMVRIFLRTTGDWLWIVDSDMTFQPDVVDRLLEHASEESPIVGALCFSQKWKDGKQGFFPTLFVTDGEDTWRMDRYPADQLIQVDATGTGCLLVHRSVFEKMKEIYEPPFPWFQETVKDGRHIGEDVTFCNRARECGFPIAVHTGIKTGHVKWRVVDESVYWEAEYGKVEGQG